MLAVAVLGIAVPLLAGCGSSGSRSASSRRVSLKLTDAGCEPHDATALAGPIDFEVENGGTGKVTELEVLEGEAVLGASGSVSEGTSGSFSLTLEPGRYRLRCSGGSEEEGTLRVTGRSQVAAGPKVEKAITEYRGYLERNAAELVEKTRPFTEAVDAGDVAKAKTLYVAPRVNYERIEPLAESFGDLGPRIDAREDEVARSEFGGFHRIEKALWEEGTTAGMKPIAEGLQSDVEELQKKVKAAKLQAVQIANYADEPLTEVLKTLSTPGPAGEEERYSRIDLVDFKADIEGSRKAFEVVAPLMGGSKPDLTKEIEEDFDSVFAALKPYERSAYPGFVYYGELTRADTRELAQPIEALAEKVPSVPAQVLRAEQA
ncbi:MAG TPA: iron uptake system protein EfeO [Solirubrobacterales bacterium]|nr:iron uptake system protein EfeO [Solirubrobacterales bacterium]